MPLKPLTSASITFEIAQTAELSMAFATLLPVEISFCVSARPELMDLRVCSATMAPLFVRMLDIECPCFQKALLRRLHLPRTASLTPF